MPLTITRFPLTSATCLAGGQPHVPSHAVGKHPNHARPARHLVKGGCCTAEESVELLTRLAVEVLERVHTAVETF